MTISAQKCGTSQCTVLLLCMFVTSIRHICTRGDAKSFVLPCPILTRYRRYQVCWHCFVNQQQIEEVYWHTGVIGHFSTYSLGCMSACQVYQVHTPRKRTNPMLFCTDGTCKIVISVTTSSTYSLAMYACHISLVCKHCWHCEAIL